ncbi:MAG TPA: hypothetical protein VK934_11715 [Fimbriimonas sp.]|nr:hypothetical protein [Fimbriimonas sp.]
MLFRTFGRKRAARKWLYVPAALAALLLLPMAALSSDPPAASLTSTAGNTITWHGTALGSGSADESTCQEGVNCDTFMLYVGGAKYNWAKKLIRVDVSWGVAANDYDLYVHKDSVSGPLVEDSGSGAPSTKESVILDPNKTGVGFYAVRVVYFATTPQTDQYVGVATTINRPASRQAVYLRGGMTFSTPVALRAPVAAADGEPSLRVDKKGNTYVAGIRGVPAGVDLWYIDLNPDSPTYDPLMRNPIYRGQPDSFTQDEKLSVGADGGGDVDIAVGFDSDDPTKPPTLAFSSLVAANVSTARSTDKGETFLLNPAGNATGGIPVDDRQWLEFFGNNTVYLLYRTLNPAVTQIQRSTDGGLTYGVAQTAGQIGQVGSIDVDQNDGTVYITGSTGKVAVGIPASPGAEPTSYTVYDVANDSGGVANIFFVAKVADDGTVYVCYSNGQNIYLKHSADKGANWSSAVRVSDGYDTRTALMPCLETGPIPGSVGIAWYGTNTATNNDASNWKVYCAISLNATADYPTFNTVPVTSHYIHSSNISTGGLDPLGGANRNLIDYFQIAFDPQGSAVIAFTDDHNDFDGHTYVTRVTSGLNVVDPTKLTLGEPEPPGTKPAHHVTDFAQDVAEGLITVAPVNDPLDILWIDYSTETIGGAKHMVAKMKVSDLSTVPTLSNWRMNFSANARFNGVPLTKDYAKGSSDTGDQFYMRAFTDVIGTQTFEWGTAVRNHDGSITYTARGTADAGSFDPVGGLITVKVSFTQLNAFARSPFASGKILCGLRGTTYTSGSGALKSDLTRGGTQYTIP